MKRRNFLSNVVLGSGSIVLGAACGRKIDPTPEKLGPSAAVSEGGNTILELARQIPILAETDVLVIGGGPAGTAASIAAR